MPETQELLDRCPTCHQELKDAMTPPAGNSAEIICQACGEEPAVFIIRGRALCFPCRGLTHALRTSSGAAHSESI